MSVQTPAAARTERPVDSGMSRATLRARLPTRANTQPAFGCYLPDAHAAIARAYGLMVLRLEGDAIAAITWFADTGAFRHFGLHGPCRASEAGPADGPQPYGNLSQVPLPVPPSCALLPRLPR
jgi:hypothetical protein